MDSEKKQNCACVPKVYVIPIPSQHQEPRTLLFNHIWPILWGLKENSMQSINSILNSNTLFQVYSSACAPCPSEQESITYSQLLKPEEMKAFLVNSPFPWLLYVQPLSLIFFSHITSLETKKRIFKRSKLINSIIDWFLESFISLSIDKVSLDNLFYYSSIN